MLTITPLMLKLIELGIQIGPNIINAVRAEIALISDVDAPDAAEQAVIDQGVEDANAALQSAQQQP